MSLRHSALKFVKSMNAMCRTGTKEGQEIPGCQQSRENHLLVSLQSAFRNRFLLCAQLIESLLCCCLSPFLSPFSRNRFPNCFIRLRQMAIRHAWHEAVCRQLLCFECATASNCLSDIVAKALPQGCRSR